MHHPLNDAPEAPRTAFTARGGEPLNLEPLGSGSNTADVVIVGGGIGGCSAALHAAEGGASVVLLEANTIGWGASGRNAGHVAPATKHDPDEIIARYGTEAGQRLIDAAEQGPVLVGDLVKRHGIDCDHSFSGIIAASHTVAALRAAEKRVNYWQARGRPVEMLDRRKAAEMIGGDYYLGAWLDRRGARISALAYTRGLARAALRAGARLHERSRATRLSRDNGKWTVQTATGSVQADKLFLCTNAYTDDLWPGLHRGIVPVRAYQITSKPLREDVRGTVLPGGQVMTDSRRLLSGVSLYPDGRLHFGGRGPAFGPEGEPHWGPTLGRIRQIFPQLAGIEIAIDCWWSGQMAMNNDNSWHIHELGPGALAMLGCNGRGVALATIYGREFARYALGAPARDFVLPPSAPKRIWLKPFAQPLVSALIRYYAIRDGIETRKLDKHRSQPA